MSDIGARSGDELYVPAKPGTNRWQKVAAITASHHGYRVGGGVPHQPLTFELR